MEQSQPHLALPRAHGRTLEALRNLAISNRQLLPALNTPCPACTEGSRREEIRESLERSECTRNVEKSRSLASLGMTQRGVRMTGREKVGIFVKGGFTQYIYLAI